MQFPFDASQVKPSEALDPIPAGWYPVAIDESEIKPTKDNTGHYLNFRLNVLDGPHKGRKLFDRLNIHNSNPVAAEIGYRQLSAICHATGVIQMADTQQLHGRPMEAKVSLRPAEGQYDSNNEVKGYRAIGAGQAQGAQPPQGAPSFAPPQPAAPAFVPPTNGATPPGGAPPWAGQPAPAPTAPAYVPPAAPAYVAPAAPAAPVMPWQQPGAAPSPAPAPAGGAPPWARP